MRRFSLAVAAIGLLSALLLWPAAQTLAQLPPARAVRPIDPGPIALPSEESSAGVTQFSFVVYGDTRGQADGAELQLAHGRVVDAIIQAVQARADGDFPVRFILLSGDGVNNGANAQEWNVSFTPLIEKLIRESRVPFFFAVGNHDVTIRPVGHPLRQPGLHNVLAAMSKLMPPEGSPHRLNGYPTFAFGYGNTMVLAIDSNIAQDPVQLGWVSRKLDSIDRERYPHVVVLFHHPVLSSGPHGGRIVEAPTEAMRRLYAPLFRRHHVRMTFAGHEHLLEHWVERYTDGTGPHRIDQIVTGGGGAPIYSYSSEPDLNPYRALAEPMKLGIMHLVRPGLTAADNPYHFLIVRVDGDQLSLEVVSPGRDEYRPYGSERFSLDDRTN
jgi:hypothetical protein